MTMQMLLADERWAGRAEGRAEGVLAAISGLMNAMNWSVERAMEAMSIPENERPQYAALLQKGQGTVV